MNHPAAGEVMLLYLIRHAEAEELGVAGLTRDFDRPLTARGRADCRALAAAFTRLGLVVDTVAASPLVRAHQTAVELLDVWNPGARPVTCDDLAQERLRPAKLTDFLAALPPYGDRVPSREEKAVAAVGHMPDLATYAEWLLGSAGGSVQFAKAGAACVRFTGEPGRAAGTLEWLVTPEWLS